MDFSTDNQTKKMSFTKMFPEYDSENREKLIGALTLAGGVCHELNQPLQIVSGYSELLSMNLSKNNPQYETICKIKEQIDRMGELTKKLMRIKKYEVKDYVKGVIFDIDKASS